MPTFAAEDDFAWSSLRPFLERCPSREAAFLLPRDPGVVCRRAVVATRVLVDESFGRLGVRVVALRVVLPEPVSLAAADLLRERPKFVVLALGRCGLPLGRAWASAPLVWSGRVDVALFLGRRALRRSDVVPDFVALLDRARLDLPPESSAVAVAVLPRLEVLAARLFVARRTASGFCVDARVPCGR